MQINETITTDTATTTRTGATTYTVVHHPSSLRNYLYDHREWQIELGATEHTARHVCPPEYAAADERAGRTFSYPVDRAKARRTLEIGSVGGWSQMALVALVEAHNAEGLNPTSSLLLTLAARVETSMQPPARGAATANTLREFAGMPDLTGVAETTLATTFMLLGQAQKVSDTPPITARRATCREIAGLLSPHAGLLTYGAGGRGAALDLWAHFCNLPGDGPRRVEIRATANREHSELVDACTQAAVLAT